MIGTWIDTTLAPKDGTPVLVALRKDLSQGKGNSYLKEWDGALIVMQYAGSAADGDQADWSVSLPGQITTVPGSWIEGWKPLDDHPADAVAAAPLWMTYKNWRGEVATRKIQPLSLRFGSTEWHPEPGWLLLAMDMEKGAEREFALADCDFLSMGAD